MSNILKVKNVSDYSSWLGAENKHPLLSVIDYSTVSPIRHSLNHYSVYGIFLRDDDTAISLTYGCGKYDYKRGTLMCAAPGQVGGKEDNGEMVNISGWALLFHPDLLHGTPLEKGIRDYSFFDYRINEALHMSDEEQAIIVSLMRQIQRELDQPKDKAQNRILVGYIQLILDYCQRFYDRQFLTRQIENSDILMRFESLLKDYFEQNMQLRNGLPSIQYCADKLCMSANYLSDLIKKSTGTPTSNHIRQFVIQRAKNALASGSTIAEVAYSLGFEYPQHFTRMFKNETGITPSEYQRSYTGKK